MQLPRGVLATLLLGVLLAGCSGSVRTLPPEWQGRDLTQPGWDNVTLPAGYTLVKEYVWSSGTVVSWDWFTRPATPLYFQIVRMQNGQGDPLTGVHRDQDTGQLMAPQAGVYDLVWRNEVGSDTVLTLNVPEGAKTTVYPPGQGPDCGGFLLLRTPC